MKNKKKSNKDDENEERLDEDPLGDWVDKPSGYISPSVMSSETSESG